MNHFLLNRPWRNTIALVVLLLSAGWLPASAQWVATTPPPIDNALLWEITGNGLERPSYLYGTVHSPDDRVFNLGDSVLPALRSCEAFATEVMIDTISHWMLNTTMSMPEVFESIGMYIAMQDGESPPKLHPMVAAVRGMRPLFVLDFLDAWRISAKTRPVFLDAWLGDYARRCGKRLHAVEDFTNHLTTIDSFSEMASRPLPFQQGMRSQPASYQNSMRYQNDLLAMRAFLARYHVAADEADLEYLLEADEYERYSMLSNGENPSTDTDADDTRVGNFLFGTRSMPRNPQLLIASARRSMIEGMIQLYCRNRLDSIEQLMSNRMLPEFFADELVIARNYIMADAIDSLSHLHPLFTAVGVAHLPGKQGIIRLLEKKGYTMRPVFASYNASERQRQLPDATFPWRTLHSDIHQMSVDVPVLPVDGATRYQPGWQTVYTYLAPEPHTAITGSFDVGTNHGYFVISTDVMPWQTVDEDLHRQLALQVFPAADSARLISEKALNTNRHNAREFCIASGKGHYGRVRSIQTDTRHYLLIGITLGEEHSAHIDRFFASFRPDAADADPDSKWIMPSDGGFSVAMPGIIRQYEAPENTSLNMSRPGPSLASFDLQNKLHYTVRYIDESTEMPINDAESRFMQIADILEYTFGATITARNAVENHTDVHELLFESDYHHYIARLYLRGARTYVVMVAGTSEGVKSAAAERFFDSFTLTNLACTQWETVANDSLGFEIRMPVNSTLETGIQPYMDTAAISRLTTRDARNGTSYSVAVVDHSPYYHSRTSDAATVLADLVYDDLYGSRELRSISTGATDHGIGIDAGFQIDDRQFLRMHYVLDGNRVYRLSVSGTREVLESADEFFGSFRVFDNRPPDASLFSNKTALLLEHLYSDDTSLSGLAARATRWFIPHPEDMPEVRRHLSRQFGNPLADRTHDELLLALLRHDTSAEVIELVERLWPRASARQSDLLLNFLAGCNAPSAPKMLVGLARDAYRRSILLPDSNPLSSYSWYYSERIGELFPEVLELVNVPVYRESVLRIIRLALLNQAVSPESLAEHVMPIVNACTSVNQTYQQIESENEYGLMLNIELLGLLPPASLVDVVLSEIKSTDDRWLRLAMVVARIRRGMQFDPGEVQEFAADIATRTTLYQELERSNAVEHIRPEYRTQQSIAESLLNAFVYDESDWYDEMFEFELLGDREIEFNNERCRVFLYRVRPPSDTTSWHLALAGPQPLSADSIDLSGRLNYLEYQPAGEVVADADFDRLIRNAQKYYQSYGGSW